MALQWDRVDVLSDVLQQRQTESIHSTLYAAEDGKGAWGAARHRGRAPPPTTNPRVLYERDVSSALQLSLELHKPEAVELLLHHRAALSKVNLCVLWAARDGGHLGLFNSSQSLAALRAIPRDLRKLVGWQQVATLREHVVPFLSSFMPSYGAFFEARISQCAIFNGISPSDAHDTASQPPALNSASRGGQRRKSMRFAVPPNLAATASSEQLVMTSNGRDVVRASDVFFWSVAAGSWELAHVLWASTHDPVRCGLLAFQMCKAMAPRLESHREQLLAKADDFQTRAKAILDALPTDVAADPVNGLLLCAPGTRALSRAPLSFFWGGGGRVAHRCTRSGGDPHQHTGWRARATLIRCGRARVCAVGACVCAVGACVCCGRVCVCCGQSPTRSAGPST